MTMNFPHAKRADIISFLKSLREEIIYTFEKMENGETFQRQQWDYHHKGGGEIAVLRGKVFEKAAVNWSGIEGNEFPLDDGKGPFFATGISLITHMANPHAPTSHFNIRFIETNDRWWFGGGYDLTPMDFSYEEDTNYFHQTAKAALDTFEKGIYETFSQNAREYFYIPHRKKERGVGGLFFDHYNCGNFEKSKKLWEIVGHSFLLINKN